jgi:hypothetical protein
MKTGFFLAIAILSITGVNAAASDFGPMFSGSSNVALSDNPHLYAYDESGAGLQNIEPAAGDDLAPQGRYVVNTTGTIEIRSNEVIQDIQRSEAGRFESDN